MSRFVINHVMAEEIWRVLADRAGASDSVMDKEDFVYHANGKPEIREYRFIGSLGMGGKVRINRERWRVDYYPEDKTDLREQLAANTNHDLEQLRQEWTEE